MTRTTPKEDLLALAQQLLIYEAARSAPDENTLPAVLVSDKLRRPLSRLAGIAGFVSLLARALSMAEAKVPALSVVEVKVDGSLEGFNGIAKQDQAEASVMLIAQLLALLAVFIGDDLVLNLVLDTWPDLSGSDHTILKKH